MSLAKWTIWKQRNKIKYQNIICKTATLIRIFKAELKENLILRQKYSEIDNKHSPWTSALITFIAV